MYFKNMISLSLAKAAGDIAADTSAGADAGGNTGADPNANMQSTPPVSDQPQAQAAPMANPQELMGQAMQNLIKTVNQMIDLYQAMSGQNPNMQGSSNTMDPNNQQQAAQPPGAPTNAGGSPAPNDQTNTQPQKAASITWSDILGY